MMRIVSTLVFFAIAVIVTLSACSSGKAALEHGNYYQAVLTSVNQLRRNPNHKKSTETLRSAYPLAVSYYEGLASNALSSNAQFKWTEVVNSYTTLNQMGDEIKRAPGALAVIPNPANYSSKLNEAKRNAAEEQYQAGIMALGLGTRDKAKEAYQYFKRSNEFVAGYKDANQKMQDALWAATVKVLVEPIPTQSRNLAVSTDFFNARLSEYLHQNQNGNEFVKFFTPTETQQLKLNPDHIVRLEFDEFTVGNVYMSEKQIPLQRDSIVMTSYVTNNLVNQNTQINQNNLVVNQNTVNNQNTNTQNTNDTNVVVTNPNPAPTNQTTNTNSGTNTNQTQVTQSTNTTNSNTVTNTNTNPTTPVNQNTNTNQTTNTNNTNPATNTQNSGTNTNVNQNTGNQTTNATNQNQNTNTNQSSNTQNSNTNTQPTEEIKIDPIPANEQVTICHVPPGNAGARHTLTISKSALKAHLDHGDFEGSCDDSKNATKLKEVDKKAADQKKNESKSNDKKGNGGGFVQIAYNPVLIASSSNDLAWHSIMEAEAAADTVKVYGTVKATLYYYAKTVTSRGVVNFSIIDAKTKAVLSVVKIPGEYIWRSEWGHFNGDERALTPQQLAITRNREQMPPSNQDMFRLFTEPIFQQVTQKIREFYKNY